MNQLFNENGIVSYFYFLLSFLIAGMCNLIGEVAAAGPRSNSPIIDVENLSEDDTDVNGSHVGMFFKNFLFSVSCWAFYDLFVLPL